MVQTRRRRRPGSEPRMTSMLDLPPDLLFNICQRLNTKERMEVMPLVCRELNTTLKAAGSALYTDLELRVAMTQGKTRLGRFRDLLSRVTAIGEETERLDLSLGNRCYSAWGAFNLAQLLGAFPRLEALTVARAWREHQEYPTLTPCGFQEVAGACPRLRELTLSSLLDRTLCSSWHALADLPALTRLRLLIQCNAAHEEGCCLNGLALLTGLRDLGLHFAWHWGAEYVLRLPQPGLAVLPNLQSLAVTGSPHLLQLPLEPCLPASLTQLTLAAACWEEVTPALEGLQGLRCLHLHLLHSHVCAGGGGADAWACLRRLTELRLSRQCAEPEDPCIQHLAVLALPALVRLRLERCTAFAGAIAWREGLPALQFADLVALPLEDAGVDLAGCAALRDLVLEATTQGCERCCAPGLTGLALGTTDAAALPSGLSRATGLRSLQLLGNRRLALDAALVEAISPLKALRWLRLCACTPNGWHRPTTQRVAKQARACLPALRAALPGLVAPDDILQACFTPAPRHGGGGVGGASPLAHLAVAQKCLRSPHTPLHRVLRWYEKEAKAGEAPRSPGCPGAVWL